MTRRELLERLKAAAKPVYGEREAAAIARLIAEKRYGLSRADIALEPHKEIASRSESAPECEATSGFGLRAFNSILADLAAARPVQYILGMADFDGLELSVGEGVLIPRPETEELVRWISQEESHARTILDIGTGSGAIAIALAKRLPEARVTAIDISPEALKYAQQNNDRTGAGITLLEADILALASDTASASPSRPDLALGAFDIIVSNPPYIPAAERTQMAANVADHEPHTALFVPDDDPLLFYRAIANFARRHLSPGGALYFEIHETAVESAPDLLKTEGFREIELRRDINDKPRMIRCHL